MIRSLHQKSKGGTRFRFGFEKDDGVVCRDSLNEDERERFCFCFGFGFGIGNSIVFFESKSSINLFQKMKLLIWNIRKN
jgi:hypothetical protein